MAQHNFKNIRQAIIDRLNKPDIANIQVAYRAMRSDFAGFPVAVVTPSSNEADYESTGTDKLTIVFEIRLYYLIEDLNAQESVDLALDDAIDELLDVFSDRAVLGDACDWVTPVPSVWEYEERDRLYRVATLTLSSVKYVDV